MNKIIYRRELRFRSLGGHAGGQICERWPETVERTKALEPVDLYSNPSYTVCTTRLLICPEPQVCITCEMEMIAHASYRGYRIKHSNAHQVSSKVFNMSELAVTMEMKHTEV